MPWQTPTLRQVRAQNRDYIVSRISAPLLPNSETRILADAGGGLAHGVFQYIDWLSLQLMADTCENEWLDRPSTIWLVNADGSNGRKGATVAAGSVTMSGLPGSIIAAGLRLSAGLGGVTYAILTQTEIGDDATATVQIQALTPGSNGNMNLGDGLAWASPMPAGVNAMITVISLTGGTDEESDDELRARLLQRIRQPPMGGDADDYVKWALAFPGCTRAWLSPREMGIGTVTLRFMLDDLRASTGGFPNANDIANMQTWIDSVRPITVLDCFVVAPIPEPISFTISNLTPYTTPILEALSNNCRATINRFAAPAYAHNGIAQPAQTIYAVWMSDAVLNTTGVQYFDFEMDDHPMPTPGSLAVLGNIMIGTPSGG
jgi:uncharacterized phage protein gp47/JayE